MKCKPIYSQVDISSSINFILKFKTIQEGYQSNLKPEVDRRSVC